MLIKITPNDTKNPPGKVADAEIHFDATSLLSGLKLIGFSIWEKRGVGGYTVTFPARSYTVNGERRSFALIRPIGHHDAQAPLRDAMIAAYQEHTRTATDQEITYHPGPPVFPTPRPDDGTEPHPQPHNACTPDYPETTTKGTGDDIPF